MPSTMRLTTLVVLGLTAAVALSGCGRKGIPVARKADGSVANAIVPSSQGTARAAPAVAISSTLSVPPAEISRNPNADKKPFILDGLLN